MVRPFDAGGVGPSRAPRRSLSRSAA